MRHRPTTKHRVAGPVCGPVTFRAPGHPAFCAKDKKKSQKFDQNLRLCVRERSFQKSMPSDTKDVPRRSGDARAGRNPTIPEWPAKPKSGKSHFSCYHTTLKPNLKVGFPTCFPGNPEHWYRGPERAPSAAFSIATTTAGDVKRDEIS